MCRPNIVKIRSFIHFSLPLEPGLMEAKPTDNQPLITGNFYLLNIIKFRFTEQAFFDFIRRIL
jgi:hypothetical protein